MNEFDFDEMKTVLSERLSEESFNHCLRTAQTALELSGADKSISEKARFAGLVHDIAKDLSDDELIEKAHEYGLQINDVEEAKPYLLHAAVGAGMLASEFNIMDTEILESVRRHTFGSLDMRRIDKIVFLADVIEPQRGFAGLENIRQYAVSDIDKAFAIAYQGQLIFILKKGGSLHPQTINVWNQIAGQVKDFGQN